MPNLDYLSIFMINNLLELPVYWAFYRFLGRESEAGAELPALRAKTAWGRFWKIAGLVTLANLCTHSMVFFGFMSTGKTYLSAVLMGAAFSTATEALLHTWAARIPFLRALSASICANLVSWQLAPLATYALFF